VIIIKGNFFCKFIWVLFLVVGSVANAKDARWYNQDQVEQGQKVFQENCAVCHGKDGASTPNWREKGIDGKFPPPPLNGTAHTWHHPLFQLKRTIREGGVKFGGNMPSFQDKLTTEQISAVIAFFQSKWNDEIYKNWLAINEPNNKNNVFSFTAEGKSSITKLLRERLGNAVIGKPKKTPAPGIYQVKIGSDYIYLTEDGRYLFTGELIDLQTRRNLTKEAATKLAK